MIKDELLYELTIEDDADEIYAISLVSDPAIEMGWVAFNKEEVKFQAIDEDKRLILGPILVPNKKILRLDGEGKPYYVFISAENIKKLSEKYLENKYTDSVTIQHEKKTDKVTLVESWIVESRVKDKSALYNLSLPTGTWAGTMKVHDDKLWEEFIKTGVLTGFSIEGVFSHRLVENKEFSIFSKEISELSDEEAEVVLKKIRAVISKDKRYKKKERIDLETYADYGDGVKNNAKRGIELNEKNGNKCATQTGKVRAQQLAKGEPISVATLKRMYSYLSRAETYYDNADSTSDCGYISYLLWGGKAALGYSRNKLRELGLLNENEAQPSIPNSSYAGEPVSGSSVPPVLQEFQECPEATQNIALNLYNRQIAVKQANYGPLNPEEANEEYWKEKAGQFEGNIQAAKKALCGNCAFFYRTPEILECIAEGLGSEVDPYDSIEAGEIGYCEAFDFKCAGKRTCSAWVTGGPIE